MFMRIFFVARVANTSTLAKMDKHTVSHVADLGLRTELKEYIFVML